MSYQLTQAKVWDGSQWVTAAGYLSPGAIATIPLEYLIIAGGGGGGGGGGRRGGGGAGGYRTNVVGQTSGRSTAAEPFFQVTVTDGPQTLPVIVGAGGGASSNGSPSQFASFSCTGGGRGAFGNTLSGAPGGAGGGAIELFGGGSGGGGTPAQGFPGGNATNSAAVAGGGGAGGAGQSNTPTGNGGAGLSNNITGTAVTRASGGGASGSSGSGVAGPPNTGRGGGAAASGGSGVVIFRVATAVPVSFSSGVTFTTETVGSNTAYIVTATSTTSETVTIG